jgi:FdhD protein
MDTDSPREDTTTRQATRSASDPLRQVSARITRWRGDEFAPGDDELVAEEPLEIRVPTTPGVGPTGSDGAFETLAAVLRTPGHDEELVAGFLFSEGLLGGRDELRAIRPGRDGDGLPSDNVRDVLPADGVDLAARLRDSGYSRRFAVNSSCGVCGKNTVGAACATFARIEPDALAVSPAMLYRLPEHLSRGQRVFHATGGLHAAGLFDPQGGLLALREDIGRHNAVDKLIGRALLDDALPLADHLLLVSGRLSFEIVLKALAARIPLVAAVSAPSSLAVELADAGGITLVAFLRGASMNVYTHPGRVLGRP